jgi:hypothetical protein
MWQRCGCTPTFRNIESLNPRALDPRNEFDPQREQKKFSLILIANRPSLKSFALELQASL